MLTFEMEHILKAKAACIQASHEEMKEGRKEGREETQTNVKTSHPGQK